MISCSTDNDPLSPWDGAVINLRLGYYKSLIIEYPEAGFLCEGHHLFWIIVKNLNAIE